MKIEPLPDPTKYLVIYTIYERPADYPSFFVVRPCWVDQKQSLHYGKARLARSLEAARGHVPRGLCRTPWQPGEDPVIAETWF